MEDESREADTVSTRIAEVLGEKTFQFSPAEGLLIHRRIFAGVFAHAGQVRSYNISKKEWILKGETVTYASYGSIKDTMDYDFQMEKRFSYQGLSMSDVVEHLAKFTADIWQIHPFCEGNTRATAVFMIKYMRALGFEVSNELFAEKSWYFRNALVRANYNDLKNGIHATTKYLEMFFHDDETAKEIQKLVRKIDAQLKKAKLVGDVHPTEHAAVIEAENRELRATAKRWDFPGFGNQKVLINARAETVMEKRMFRDNVQYRRIAIPAAGFYEWNQAKEKATFTAEETEQGKARILYLAGFYGNFDGEDRFIILTTEANESMKDVHHRMPLILEQDEVKGWLCDDSRLNQFLRKQPSPLKKHMKYEQQRLMF